MSADRKGVLEECARPDPDDARNLTNEALTDSDRQALYPATQRAHLCVGSLPGRKSPYLYVDEGAEIRPIARFQSREAMYEFLSFNPKWSPKGRES